MGIDSFGVSGFDCNLAGLEFSEVHFYPVREDRQ